MFTDIAPYGKIKTLSFHDGVFPFRKIKLMMFFLWEKLNVPSVITGENIYRKSFGTFLVKSLLLSAYREHTVKVNKLKLNIVK